MCYDQYNELLQELVLDTVYVHFVESHQAVCVWKGWCSSGVWLFRDQIWGKYQMLLSLVGTTTFTCNTLDDKITRNILIFDTGRDSTITQGFGRRDVQPCIWHSHIMVRSGIMNTKPIVLH